MSRYRVVIQGRGLKIPSGDHFVVGFFATRLVESDSIENTKYTAIENIRNELQTDEILRTNTSNEFEFLIDNIEKIGFFDMIFKTFPRKGFTFYQKE